MRVLYVSRGSTVHDRRFLRAITAAGLDVGWFRLSGPPAGQPLPPGVRDLTPSPAGTGDRRLGAIGVRRNLAMAIRAYRPTLVHAGPIQQGAFPAALAGARPLVSMSWGSDLLRDAAGGLGRWQAKYVLTHSDLVLCDCQAARRRAIELGASESKLVVFPWGVDLKHFRPGSRPAIRAQLGWGDSFIVLSARTLEPIYGVDVVVEGFLRAADEEPKLRLLVLSDGSQRGPLERRIAKAGMKSRVHFAGVIDETKLPDYYRAADLYVSASHSDGSSVTLLEAMACGLPVLVSEIPGNREWVAASVNGWLFPDGDAQALASGLRGACAGADRLREMGKVGRATVEARADWSSNSRMLVDAYQLVTSQAKRNAP